MVDLTVRVALWSKDRLEPYIDQLAHDLAYCRDSLEKDGSKIIILHGKKARVSLLSTGAYIALGVATDADRIKSKKLLDQELKVTLAAAPMIDASTRRSEQRTRRLIHNLKTLTAKTTQEIFYLVKQESMMAHPREAVRYVEDEIRDNTADTAKAIIAILKHQQAQKAEFAAFEKLSGKVEPTKMEMHDIHRVLMNLFYLFFGDFSDKKIRANVEPTKLQAFFDYDSIYACIFYLVENAAKYTMRNSSLNVTVSPDNQGYVDIRFEMQSLAINPDESHAVFSEGVSGKHAHANKLNGAGIGLFLARAMANLNAGTLTLNAGKPMIAGCYARNSFILSLRAEPLTTINATR
ncbi:HAMP domain-containing sensor histidine kinase [Pseudomonas sp. NFACC37-1]|uniref:sensor histidine kinase n=1 Tax=Pseudomonas sp. NFACC37-1 TaxID=1566196 RepID=UPI000883C31C|nr:ATP-binding protein [Pseudomonas sp. NFACC37-1]SCX93068.1 Signal transduction histidine kinase [Pseudomonas sp. NFACC37-1]